MKRCILYILMLAAGATASRAQAIADTELKGLVEMVISLRGADQATYSRIQEKFVADPLWTPMDELGAVQSTECKASDRVPSFKLNRLLNQADNSRKFVYTHGDMLNGEDSRYNYSLYERAIRGGQKAAYSLKGRVGSQVFVVIPYDGSTAGLKVSAPGSKAKSTDGYIVIEIKRPDGCSDPVDLTIENSSAENRSVVIVNYNTRK